ncbi:ABC transporter substrate-binding protein [Variovorax sp. RT4R15]|uniref:ABC transporter substrate-binding protein n=1 Tax=Variovorax sp. RT4R15 TaxID=3443737 RepID=UPI003F463F18
MKLSVQLVSAALAVLAIVSTALAPTPAQAAPDEEDVKFALDFIPLGRHAPWYVALSKGYFKEEKLNVSILPTKGTADAIRFIETGLTEFGFVDIPSLVASGSGGSSVRIVAGIYQRAPYCVFSMNPGANVTSPAGMVGLEMGSSSASFMPRIFSAFMKLNNLDPSTLKIVNIDGAARVPMLVSNKVQSIDQFLMGEPSIRRAATNGAQPTCLLLADHGLDIYANSIGVREEFLKKNPAAVRGFVRAALRGWKYALANPEEAAKIQTQYLKALDPTIIVEELKILRRIAITPEVEARGFGTLSRDKLARTVGFISQNVTVPGTPPTVDQMFVDGFLPEPPIKP